MSFRRALVPAAVLFPAACAAVLPLAEHAGAASNLEVGWWWVGQAQPGAAPAPPNVPSGGLWVSADPQGPHALSALRFSLGELETSPIITLKIDRETPDGGASLLACPITSPWAPVTAGDWNSKPQYNCANNVQPTRAIVDGTNAIAFDLSSIVVGKNVDVAIVPLVGPPQAPAVQSPLPGGVVPDTSSTFDITFAAPSDANITTFTLPDDDDQSGNGAAIPNSPFASTDTSPLVFDPTATSFPSLLTPPSIAQTPPIGPLRRIVVPTSTGALAKADGRSASRILAGVVFLALALWWYRLTFAGAESADKRTRPRITIYDDPKRVLASTGQVRAPRTGKVPTLR